MTKTIWSAISFMFFILLCAALGLLVALTMDNMSLLWE